MNVQNKRRVPLQFVVGSVTLFSFLFIERSYLLAVPAKFGEVFLS